MKKSKVRLIDKGVDFALLGKVKDGSEKITNITHLGTTQGYLGKSVKYIFTVTSIDARNYLKSPALKGHDSRCWGWYPTLKEAQTAVTNNAGDMAECCYYTHAIIQKLGSGIPAEMFSETKEYWYEWIVDPNDPHRFHGKWQKCEKPKWSSGIVGWGIG